MYNFDYFNKYSWLFWRHVKFNLSVILLIYMFGKKNKSQMSVNIKKRYTALKTLIGW